MEFFDNHKKLFRTALGLFVGLTIIVAIMPAINNKENNTPLPGYEPLSQEAYLGKKSFIANGCVACHTQQVRNVDMDNVWGSRPGIPADYAGNRIDFWTNNATLMGTERTGPDLTNIGLRQPSLAWNLLHIYQPRAVVEKSIMPAYPWLFEIKSELSERDVRRLPGRWSLPPPASCSATCCTRKVGRWAPNSEARRTMCRSTCQTPYRCSRVWSRSRTGWAESMG